MQCFIIIIIKENKTMSNYVLVILDSNWADEFDVNAFWVTTQEEYDIFINKISKVDLHGQEFYFGTNEWISFHSTEDLLSALTVSKITREFYNDLIFYFGETYGLISIPDLLERFDEDEFENL